MIELFGDPPEELYEDVSEEERKCGHELKGWSAIPEKKDIDPTLFAVLLFAILILQIACPSIHQ